MTIFEGFELRGGVAKQQQQQPLQKEQVTEYSKEFKADPLKIFKGF